MADRSASLRRLPRQRGQSGTAALRIGPPLRALPPARPVCVQSESSDWENVIQNAHLGIRVLSALHISPRPRCSCSRHTTLWGSLTSSALHTLSRPPAAALAPPLPATCARLPSLLGAAKANVRGTHFLAAPRGSEGRVVAGPCGRRRSEIIFRRISSFLE